MVEDIWHESSCSHGRHKRRLQSFQPTAGTRSGIDDLLVARSEEVGSVHRVAGSEVTVVTNSSRMQKMFELLAQDRQSKARHGRLTTVHSVIETPAFMPIGTQGSVK